MRAKSLIIVLCVVFTVGFLIGNHLFSDTGEEIHAGPKDRTPVTDSEPEIVDQSPPVTNDENIDKSEPIEEPPSDSQQKVKVAYSKPNNSIVNVRTGPGLNFDIVAKIEKEVPMVIIEERDDWFRVKLEDGRFAWVAKRVVDVKEE